MTAAATVRCPGCGDEVAAAASEGLCPGCLLGGVLDRGDMADVAPEDPVTLRRCGDYEILGVIARGGMGVVFRARQDGLSREVALKMIAAADLAAPDEVRRFRLEAEVIARLDHPNIIPVHTVGEHDGRPFFVMKLAENTLADRLNHPAAVPSARESAVLMIKVARAVQFAHDRGILHRDLKPANVLLDAAGEPLVSDFGLARFAFGPGGSTLTGAALGTPGYMPPEQVRGAGEVTTLSDVYSLGAILYHLLSGRPPFSGDSLFEVLRRVESEEPVSPRLLNLQTDRDLATVCLKCLEKQPARRYVSAAAMADDIERWLRGEAVVARPAPWHERLWKWARRRPAAATLAVAAVAGTSVLAAVLVVGNFILRRERNVALSAEAAARAGTLRAETSERAMALNVYASDIFLARRALEDGHLGVARRTLERHLPAEGQPDLRGFEWHALKALCRGDDLRVLTNFSSAVLTVKSDATGRLAAACRDGTLRVFRTSDGSLVKQLPDQAPSSKFAELAFLAALPIRSPDTAALLAGSVSVDEVRMRARPSSFGEIRSIAWSPDGEWVIIAGVGSYVRLFRTSDWSYQGFIPVRNAVQAEFTPDSSGIILALGGQIGNPGEIRMYARSNLASTLSIRDTSPCFAVSSRDGRIAVSRIGGQVEIYDPGTGKPVQSWQGGSAATAIAVTPDGSRLVVLHPQGGSLWNVNEARLLGRFARETDHYRAVAFAPDGLTFAAGGSGHVIQLFDGVSAAPGPVLRGHDDEVLALSFAGSAGRLVSGSNDRTVREWRVPPERSGDSCFNDSGTLAAVPPSGGRMLVSDEGGVRCIDTSTGTATEIRGPGRRVLGFRPDGMRFATLQRESGTVEWWETDGKPAGMSFKAAALSEGSAAVCESAGWIACAPVKKLPIPVLNWETGEIIRTLPAPPVKVSRLLASPNGRFLAAFAWPQAVSIFDFGTGTWRESEKISDGTSGPIVFSPDGSLLATGGDDNIVSVREVASGRLVTSLRGHMAEIKSLAFSPDGRTLASSSADLTLRLWHVPTWRELGSLHRGSLCPTLLFAETGLFVEEYRSRILFFRGK